MPAAAETTWPAIVVYSREGCHLCAEAERMVADVAAGKARVTVVDIDTDPALIDRYTVRVPVVVVDGTEVAELMVDRATLEQAVESAARP